MKKQDRQPIIPRNNYNKGFNPSSQLTDVNNFALLNTYYTIKSSRLLYFKNSISGFNYINNNSTLPYFKFYSSIIRLNIMINLNSLTRIFEFTNSWYNIFAPYSRSFIIRGIGYRMHPVLNINSINTIDNSLVRNISLHTRYVYLRVGHSYPTYCGVPNHIGLRTLKKDRKLIVYGFNSALVGLFSDRLFYYRPPNAFTGRGIRFKGIRYKRKPGKRAQKGRGF